MTKPRLTAAAALVALSVLGLLWWHCLPNELFAHTPYSTVVTGADGTLLGARVATDGQWRFPPAEEPLPPKFVTALIEFEDRTFHLHPGVSPRALCRAMVQNLRCRRVVSGASTLTMQVVRLARPGKRTLWRKLAEMCQATRLEARYSKEQILRLYAAHAPFGGNVVGLQAALWRYMGTDGAELSWAQAATLAVLQNAPAAIHLQRHRPQLLAKRNRLLQRLYERGKMERDDYMMARDEPLMASPRPMPALAPHLVEHCHSMARGQHTCTAISPQLQRRVEEALQMWSDQLRPTGVTDMAAVVIDVASAQAVAYCGNTAPGGNRPGWWVDMARAPRSSGSILKPLLYAAALQEGLILPHTLLPDVPTDFGGFAPKNFDGTYAGAIAADQALALSLNVPAVGLLQRLGVGRFVHTLQRCGLSTLTRPAGQYGLALALGGAEVRLLEVAQCYARMAACYAHTASHPHFPLRQPVALYHTLQAMRQVGRPDQMDWRRVSSVQQVAWKTGTSYGARDAWAVGITPRYVVGVWAGRADGGTVPGLTGGHTAGPVMFHLMSLVPQSHWWAQPSPKQGVSLGVCSQSGHLAGRHCQHIQPQLLPPAAQQSQVCPYCQQVTLSADGQWRVADRSEPTRREARFCLPPIIEHYYRPLHPAYQPLPPLRPGTVASERADMSFLYPTPGTVVGLPLQAHGQPGQMVCKVAHAHPQATLYWHLDGAYMGATDYIHHMAIAPAPGPHTLAVVDHLGATITVPFVVK